MSAADIAFAQKILGRYGLSALVIFGNIGNLLNISIFIRSLIKQANSCKTYLLAASITNWVLINTTLISSLYGVDHVDPQHQSLVVCKLRWYGGQILLMLSRSCMIAACVDRWALTSANARIRSYARPEIVRYVIPALMLTWCIIPVHMAIFVNNNTGRCGTPSFYAFAFGMYLLFFIGILPPTLMLTFGTLAWHNLQQMRRRVQPIDQKSQNRASKLDRDLMRMLTGEVLVYLITTLLYPANVLYGVVTTSMGVQKTPLRSAIDSLIGFIISPLLNYVYCVAPFYIYMVCSSKFRREFLGLFRRQEIVQ